MEKETRHRSNNKNPTASLKPASSSTSSTTIETTSTTSTQFQQSKHRRRQRRQRRQRRPTNNQLQYCPQIIIMAFCTVSLSALLVFLIFINKSQFIAGQEYLYNTPDEDVWPIIDYITPVRKALEARVDYEDRIMHPDFLSSAYDKPRLVEFYAPWCGHCQHYKPRYIKLGKDSKDVVPDLEFFAVSCVANSKLCRLHEIHGYPSLNYLAANSDKKIKLKNPYVNAEHLYKAFYLKYDGNNTAENVGGDLVPDTNQKDTMDDDDEGAVVSIKPVWKSSTGKDVFTDAAASLTFALRTSIFMTNNALTPKQQKVFQEWLTLLSKTIPRKDDVMKQSLIQISSLQYDIEYVVQSEENLVEILNAKGVPMWTESCKKGYTCGLWQLLHIITIGLVHYNDSNASDVAISTMSSADTIRDYIEYYFTCDECRKNFVQMYEKCQFNRCNRLSYEIGSKTEWKQLALWLWETHNDVNVRLLHESKNKGDIVTPNEEQQVRWPPTSECPSCWQEGGGWNEEAIFDFLDSFYWPKDATKHGQLNKASIEVDEVQSYGYIITIVSVLVLLAIVQLRKKHRQMKSMKK